jgi:sugar PTS system EIIA component
LAIDPSRAGPVDVVAPVTGTVVALHPHAVVVEAAAARGVLVHLGVDTLRLGGEGFAVHVSRGDAVVAGDRLVTWNPAAVEAAGLSPVCPLAVLEAAEVDVRLLVSPGDEVIAGTPLLVWD